MLPARRWIKRRAHRMVPDATCRPSPFGPDFPVRAMGPGAVRLTRLRTPGLCRVANIWAVLRHSVAATRSWVSHHSEWWRVQHSPHASPQKTGASDEQYCWRNSNGDVGFAGIIKLQNDAKVSTSIAGACLLGENLRVSDHADEVQSPIHGISSRPVECRCSEQCRRAAARRRTPFSAALRLMPYASAGPESGRPASVRRRW